jgi:steroid delta-isomerase-like uncharacterized protein
LQKENFTMTTEQNKALVRQFFTAFEANDQDALKEILAPDLVAYSHGAPGPQNREVHLQGIAMWNAAFNETRFTIEEQIAEGDKVATRSTMRSVHSGGDFQGLPPTGKQVQVDGVTIERIKDGKIVERRVSGDWLGIMQQLGLVPPPQPAS